MGRNSGGSEERGMGVHWAQPSECCVVEVLDLPFNLLNVVHAARSALAVLQTPFSVRKRPSCMSVWRMWSVSHA